VAVVPANVRVTTGASVSFGATVTGTSNGVVTWSVMEGPAGGTVDGSGQYVAPAAPGTFHVVATSRADPTISSTAIVTVVAPTAITVIVTPSTATLNACASTTFSATSSGASGVTWSVREGASGGTVSTSGAYTAPTTPGTYHVVATSVADGTASAEAAVTVGPEKVLAVAVVPGSASVVPGGALAFAATVTTSCGTFAAQ
jgi:hypothetical protein